MTRFSMELYYWPRSFILRGKTFEQAHRDRPYQRLAATLVVSLGRPFVLELEGQTPREYRAVLLSPAARRRHLRFSGDETWMFDAGIGGRGHLTLRERLRVGAVQALKSEEIARLQALLLDQPHPLEPEAARSLQDDVLAIVGSAQLPPRPDPRVARIMELVNISPREALTVAGLAETVGLSASRLRSLVQRELGCSLSQYLRWVTAWRAIEYWAPGVTFTEAAHAAGFHDLAHASHTLRELFGLPPSWLKKHPDVWLRKC